MPKRKTHEEYIEQLQSVNPNIKCLEPYINSKIKIKHQCLKCGYIWKVIPNDILRNCGCKKCNEILKTRKLSKTHKQYIIDLKITNQNIKCLGKYTRSNIKIKHICLECGYIWNVRPNYILKGRGCPKCKKRARRTNKDYLIELKSINTPLIPIEKYISSITPLKHKCKNCNNIVIIRPSDVLHNIGCFHCAKKNRVKTTEYYMNKLKLINPDIKPIGEYIRFNKKIKHQCLKCNHIWDVSPTHTISRRHGCPNCYNLKNSKGEKRIKKFLTENNIVFKTQYRFKDLYYKKYSCKLSFDFYIPQHRLLIEYNGKQHYTPIKWFGGEENFKTQVIRDNLKLKYTNKNDYKLLIIKYTEFNSIESILNSVLMIDI